VHSVANNSITLPAVDAGDPFTRALLKDAMNIYYPNQEDRNDSILTGIIGLNEKKLRKNLESYQEETLSFSRVLQILGMYIRFLIVYVLVMMLTYYGVQTMGVWRFVRKKRSSQISKNIYPNEKVLKLKVIGTGFGKLLAYLILFSPSYVIAYSMRTEFSTDSTFFMVLLGVISNGLLVTYANKFYSFLLTESRKGYVETARVKNLCNSYLPEDVHGITMKDILKPIKRFDNHVFGHIFANARYQYISTIKEQAAFLVTGLVIIEMALNIHGHFSYEMLKQMLYRNYDIVLVFFLGIFYTVKLTEMATDWVLYREMLKYENR